MCAVSGTGFGLSLCIQGTRQGFNCLVIFFRFIPMYIGNTFLSSSATCTTSVYPYVYREHHVEFSLPTKRRGLSLCIQGTPKFSQSVFYTERFIPMYIGNTCRTVQIGLAFAVYPYVYREHCLMVTPYGILIGLSLCIQGTRRGQKFLMDCRRFIPMYIGNTRHHRMGTKKAPVYPYVYREHVLILNNLESRSGLSLCIQGTRIQALIHRHEFRFIPMYIGNTITRIS